MTMGLCYWILMLLWLIGALRPWFGPTKPAWGSVVGDIVLFILLLLLGWQVYGAPIK